MNISDPLTTTLFPTLNRGQIFKNDVTAIPLIV
jgi:hypothetical protein